MTRGCVILSEAKDLCSENGFLAALGMTVGKQSINPSGATRLLPLAGEEFLRYDLRRYDVRNVWSRHPERSEGSIYSENGFLAALGMTVDKQSVNPSGATRHLPLAGEEF
jgi:hypothetical protein